MTARAAAHAAAAAAGAGGGASCAHLHFDRLPLAVIQGMRGLRKAAAAAARLRAWPAATLGPGPAAAAVAGAGAAWLQPAEHAAHVGFDPGGARAEALKALLCRQVHISHQSTRAAAAAAAAAGGGGERAAARCPRPNGGKHVVWLRCRLRHLEEAQSIFKFVQAAPGQQAMDSGSGRQGQHRRQHSSGAAGSQTAPCHLLLAAVSLPWSCPSLPACVHVSRCCSSKRQHAPELFSRQQLRDPARPRGAPAAAAAAIRAAIQHIHSACVHVFDPVLLQYRQAVQTGDTAVHQ